MLSKMMIPEMMIPEMMIPEMMIPEMMIPEMVISEMLISEMLIPEMALPEFVIPPCRGHLCTLEQVFLTSISLHGQQRIPQIGVHPLGPHYTVAIYPNTQMLPSVLLLCDYSKFCLHDLLNRDAGLTT